MEKLYENKFLDEKMLGGDQDWIERDSLSWTEWSEFYYFYLLNSWFSKLISFQETIIEVDPNHAWPPIQPNHLSIYRRVLKEKKDRAELCEKFSQESISLESVPSNSFRYAQKSDSTSKIFLLIPLNFFLTIRFRQKLKIFFNCQ